MRPDMYLLLTALIIAPGTTALAQGNDTPEDVAARFLTAARDGDANALGQLMADGDWEKTHPILVAAMERHPWILESYLVGGEVDLQEVVERSPDALGIENLARVMLRSTRADTARPLYLVWVDGGWKVGTPTGLLVALSPPEGEVKPVPGSGTARGAFHAFLEGLYLASLGETHAGTAITRSVLHESVTDSALQMALGHAEQEPYVLYSYAEGTSTEQGYEDFSPFGFQVVVTRQEQEDDTIRAYAVSSGARQPKPFGLVAANTDQLRIDGFSGLLVGIKEPSEDGW
ncbi:MAG: hypothetical protein GF320_20235 [Armatimonadia bacterium]|nr:hypothetical protein [Armatimonadia bacterium]